MELNQRQLIEGSDEDYIVSTLLHDAVHRGSILKVEYLIKKGVNIHAKDKDGRTPLQLAKWLKIRDGSHTRRRILTLLTNAHKNKQYEQKPLTISFDQYDKLQFKSQYAIDLVASYMNKPADIVNKLENIEVSYNSKTQLLQETNDLIKTYLVEAKRLQDEIVSNRVFNQLAIENINFVSTTDSELQTTDISSSIIDDDYQVMDSKIVNSNQQQKASPTKKAIYAIMITSPFIAVGIYTAIALSTDIVEFNPIVAAGIFVDIATLAIMCFAVIKISEKVNEEKNKDENINSCITSSNNPITKCFKGSKVATL